MWGLIDSAVLEILSCLQNDLSHQSYLEGIVCWIFSQPVACTRSFARERPGTVRPRTSDAQNRFLYSCAYVCIFAMLPWTSGSGQAQQPLVSRAANQAATPTLTLSQIRTACLLHVDVFVIRFEALWQVGSWRAPCNSATSNACGSSTAHLAAHLD